MVIILKKLDCLFKFILSSINCHPLLSSFSIYSSNSLLATMAADALVSKVLEQLASIAVQQLRQEVRLVVGVETEVQSLTDTLQSIRAVLVDAEKKQVTEEAVKVWLGRLKDISYEIDDVLDEWSSALLKLQIENGDNAAVPKKKECSYFPSPCFCFSGAGGVVLRRDIALKVKELKERLDSIASEKRDFNFETTTSTEEFERPRSTSFVDVSGVCGRDQDKETIVRKLCDSSEEERGFQIISIVALGGMGKTTLAQFAYNHDGVKARFQKTIWVCVSDPFDELKIAKDIATALDVSDPTSLNLELLSQRIHESIAGKKFLLVLDDVWPHDYRKWEVLAHPLRNGLQGSRILVTTRDTRVAKMMDSTYIHPLVKLSEEECWLVFSQMAHFGSRENREQLEEIGRKIADKCKGLPLAAKTLGSLMRFKETKQEWQNVLDSEMWELDDVEKGIFSPLLLSYYDLPPALKRCFSYCAVFPKDYLISREGLINLWMAQGYLSSRRSIELEMIGEEYFESLAMRSFFQDFVKDRLEGRILCCKMHDIVHDFAQFLAKNECFLMEVGGGKEPNMDLSFTKSRHSSIVLAKNASFPVSIFNTGNLHTLLVLYGFGANIGNALPDVFHHLKFLRALDLSYKSITELPRDVGILIHLRYLNLFGNKFEKLPETVCDLCNLQTLDLVDCQFLKELPKGIGKLINLRHLKLMGTPQLGFLPKGITRLSSLRKLSDFIVSGVDNREACKLEDLRSLNLLQKHLRIRGLGNLGDAGEAEKAELKSMVHLFYLELDFSPMAAKGKMEDVIEALQPHPNLESLRILQYGGPLLPSWTMQLTKLKWIVLVGCPNIVCLHPLGILPFLESLDIRAMNSVKKVGVEFWGLGINDNDGTIDKDDVIIAFPKLKHLFFNYMMEWEEWDEMITTMKITIMPCLSGLILFDCPKLKALPHRFRTMYPEKLIITLCPILEKQLQQQRGEERAETSHTPSIQISD